MKKDNIIYWVFTGLIVLTQGVLQVLNVKNPEMVANLRTMGYPEHFAGMLTFWKVLGVLAIAIPQVPARFKEWAYGCFFVEFLCAAYVLFVTPDFSNQVAFPLVFVAILAGSYYYYHKLKAAN